MTGQKIECNVDINEGKLKFHYLRYFLSVTE